MKPARLSHYTLSVAALLTGCGGSQPSIPAPGAMPRGRMMVAHPDRGGSWTLPEAAKETLIYIATSGSPLVYVYTYQGKKVGKIDVGTPPQGECVDNAGDVWIMQAGTSELTEYAHGGTTPIATLGDPGQEPAGCSVDTTTGDLAVTNSCSAPSCGNGNVVIFAKGREKPKSYFFSNINHYYDCAYDNAGDLVVSGRNNDEKPSDHRVFYATLYKGAKALESLTLPKDIRAYYNVQWAGQSFAVEGFGVREIGTGLYHFSIDGTHGNVRGVTVLKNAAVIDFSIVRNQAITLDIAGFVSFWRFPSGRVVRSFVLWPPSGGQLPIVLAVSPPRT